MSKEPDKIILPAEWHKQCAVMLTWPHEATDWRYILDDVTNCYVDVAHEIVKHEKLIVVCKDEKKLRKLLADIEESILFREIDTNDTWARDHGPITVFVDGEPFVYDFQFNGWGLKFASNLDNQITRKLYDSDVFSSNVGYFSLLNYVLEGGSIESDGKGTLMTTSECLTSVNRNEGLSKNEIEAFLKEVFGLKRVLWIHSGSLAGDDTDSHVDTLARFCDEQTIAYMQCTDKKDEHYDALKEMEDEIKQFRTLDGKPYRLIPLPMPTAQYEGEERLPATYANFLIINEVVLMPTYHCGEDEIALKQLKTAFPNREIIGVDCRMLIRQHGSLHCITMQLPEGLI